MKFLVQLTIFDVADTIMLNQYMYFALLAKVHALSYHTYAPNCTSLNTIMHTYLPFNHILTTHLILHYSRVMLYQQSTLEVVLQGKDRMAIVLDLVLYAFSCVCWLKWSLHRRMKHWV